MAIMLSTTMAKIGKTVSDVEKSKVLKRNVYFIFLFLITSLRTWYKYKVWKENIISFFYQSEA